MTSNSSSALFKRGGMATAIIALTLFGGVVSAGMIGLDSRGGLTGAEVFVGTRYQETANSEPVTVPGVSAGLVSETAVEVESLPTFLQAAGYDTEPVDLSFDFGDDYVEIGFANSGRYRSFAPGLFNGLTLSFESLTPFDFTAVDISPLTSLRLQPSDIAFFGNQIEVNFEGLAFNTRYFARLDFTTAPRDTAEVPLPATVGLLTLGLVGFGLRKFAAKK